VLLLLLLPYSGYERVLLLSDVPKPANTVLFAPPVAAVVVFSLSYYRILYGFYREFRKVLCSTS